MLLVTGKHGSLHTRGSLDYGTKVVDGINPNKAGSEHIDLRIFANVTDSMNQTGAEDLEHIFIVGVLPNVPHNLVEQLRLGEWVRGVGGEVIGVFLLLGHVRAHLGLLVVKMEVAHKVSLRYHNFMRSSDVLLTRGQVNQSILQLDLTNNDHRIEAHIFGLGALSGSDETLRVFDDNNGGSVLYFALN